MWKRSLLLVLICSLSVVSFKLFENLYDTRRIAGEACLVVNKLHTGDSVVSIPFFTEAPGIHIFRFYFGEFSCDTPSIFIPFIDGNYVAIYLNGQLIGMSGNPFGRTSLRWNKPELFLFEKDLLSDVNEVSIVVKAENTVGIFSPILLGDFKQVAKSYLILGFFNQILNQFYIVTFFILGLFMILLPFLIGLRKHRALIGLSLILLAMYLVDYTYIPYLPIPYSFYKKIVVSCLYLSLSLYGLGFVYEFGYRGFLKFISVLILACNVILSIILLATVNDSVMVRRTYIKMDVTVFFSMVFIVLIFLRKALKSDSKSSNFTVALNFYAIAFLLPYVFRDIYVLVGNLPKPLLTQYVLPVFVLINVSYVINDFVTLYKRLILEKRRAEFLEMESMRDPLTGALNRRFLLKIREIIPELYTVCLIDIDGFKEFNDRFGHLMGDCVLKKVVSSFVSMLRKDDYVVRYGGDEFIILLYRSSEQDAEQILGKIRERLIKQKIHCEGQEFVLSFSYGIAPIGEGHTLDEMLKIADSRLYEVKNSKMRA
uniref:GGDEF domain-containing protein n=1 Tax=candidate division WOR-3 bacterium TaxID=2052148 RepID=A0A7C2K4T5_UNCW3